MLSLLDVRSVATCIAVICRPCGGVFVRLAAAIKNKCALSAASIMVIAHKCSNVFREVKALRRRVSSLQRFHSSRRTYRSPLWSASTLLPLLRSLSLTRLRPLSPPPRQSFGVLPNRCHCFWLSHISCTKSYYAHEAPGG